MRFIEHFQDGKSRFALKRPIFQANRKAFYFGRIPDREVEPAAIVPPRVGKEVAQCNSCGIGSGEDHVATIISTGDIDAPIALRDNLNDHCSIDAPFGSQVNQ